MIVKGFCCLWLITGDDCQAQDGKGIYKGKLPGELVNVTGIRRKSMSLKKKHKGWGRAAAVVTAVAVSFSGIPLPAVVVQAAEAPVDKTVTAQFGTPTLDGEIDEVWEKASSYSLEQPRLLEQGSGEVRLLWDDNALYVLAKVYDENLDSASGNSYEQDSIEVFLDELYDGGTKYQSDDLHYRVNYENRRTTDAGTPERWYTAAKPFTEEIIADAVEQAYDDVSKGDVSGDIAGRVNEQRAVIGEKHGYIVESCIRWDKVTPENGREYGFDAQINAAENGRRVGTLNLFDATGNAYQNPSLFGRLVLEGKQDGDESGVFPFSLMYFMEQVAGMDLSIYANGEIVTNALHAARALLDSGSFTQEQLDEAHAAIQDAIDNLDDGSGMIPAQKLPAIPEVPDIMTFEDGVTKVTRENWPERAAEIKKLYEYYMYGPMPDTSGEKVSYTLGEMEEKTVAVTDPVTSEQKSVKVKQGTLTINIENNGRTGSFNTILAVPAGAAPEGGYPVFSEMGMWASNPSSNCYYAASRGYASVTWNYTSVAADSLSRTGAFYSVYPYGRDWKQQTGALVAWSWGAGKILDVLEGQLGKDYNINAGNNILGGVSRLGKATAVAGAYEPRIKVVMPTCSGAGGMAMFRYDAFDHTYDMSALGGAKEYTYATTEPLSSLQSTSEAHWFNDNFLKFKSVEQLPFDQHYLAALCADPDRYLVMVGSATNEDWVNAPSMNMSYLAARGIYDTLGLSDHLAYNVHLTTHGIILQDMAYLLDYCDVMLYGKNEDEIATDLRDIKTNVFLNEDNYDRYAEDYDPYVSRNLTDIDVQSLAGLELELEAGMAAGDVEALLPESVRIYVDTVRTLKADITWDVAGSGLNGAGRASKELIINGKVNLPDGISNPDGISLDVSVKASQKINMDGMLMTKHGTPFVDGKGDDEVWENAYAYKTAQSQDGQYAQIKTLWDKEAMYVLVNVFDPSYDVTGSDAHTKDSVEFFFLEPSDAALNSFGRTGGQWRINRANVTTVTFGQNEPFYGKVTEMADGKGYIVEARLEFADGVSIKDGTLMNFDVAVNLCTGGKRTEAIAWTSTDCYSNPSKSGQVIYLSEDDNTSAVPEGYNPYALLKVLDKALVMDRDDYYGADFDANYDKAQLQKYFDEASAGTLSAEKIKEYYDAAIAMMSGITYDGEHKSALGFEADHTIPDPFTSADGSKVYTPDDWDSRREEIQDLYEFYMYGQIPDAGTTGLTKQFSEEGTAYTITASRGEVTRSFTFTVNFPEGDAPEGGWPYIINYGRNIAAAVEAGYAVVEYSSNGTVAGNNSKYTGVFYDLYPECRGDKYDGGVGPLVARVWGVGLILDCIEAGTGRLSELNPKNSAVTGFSYLGKNALITGALEKRIAVTNPAHSGMAGAAMLRWSSQGKSYTMDEYGFTRDYLIKKTEPIGQGQGQGAAWVKTIFADFIGADNTPFDTHMLLSLVAPRGLFVSAGYYDDGTDPEGMYASYLGAQQVYKLLGEEQNIAFGSYPTAHQSSANETADFIAFCDNYFYGKPLPENFYKTVYDNSPDRADYDVIRVPEKGADVNYGSAVIGNIPESDWDLAKVLRAAGVVKEEGREPAASNDGIADIRVLWDDTYLYLKAFVADEDVYISGNNNEDEDSITFTLAKNTNAGKEVTNYVFTAGGAALESFWSTSFFGASHTYAAADQVYAVTHKTDKGWSLEACIEWKALGIDAGNGAGFAMEAVVNSCSSATGKRDFRRALYLTKYPQNMETSSGWMGPVTYNAGLYAKDLAGFTMRGKTVADTAENIGRYDLLKYIDSFEETYVEPYPVKGSFDPMVLEDARSYALLKDADKEGIARWNGKLDDMKAAILKDNYQGMLMTKHGTPLVDGKADDKVWENTYTYKTGAAKDGQYAQISTLWDKDALFVLAKVFDPSYDVTGTDAHTKDSVEFFLLDSKDAEQNSFGKNGGQWRINRANDVTVTFGQNEPFYGRVTEMEDGNGYIVEARLQFAEGENIMEGSVMNFDLGVNLCANGSRTEAVGWTSTDCYSNPSKSGKLIFLGEDDKTSVVKEGYNPYALFKLLDKALAMDKDDYYAPDFDANYDKAKLQKYYDLALSGSLSADTIAQYYNAAIDMMSRITYDGVHKSALGFEADHEFPDLFTRNDGSKVYTADDWAARREEIQDMYEFYMYGQIPDAEKTGLTKSFSAEGSNYTVTVARNGITRSFTFKADIPEGEAPKGGWPYIINYGGNVSGAQDAGYAVIEYSNHNNVANGSNYTGIFYDLYPECKGDQYANGVGPLVGRAWGAGLIIDCIEAAAGRLSELNPENSAVTGFSYLGKTALITGALEKRIKVTNPAHSGMVGAAVYRWSSQGKFYSADEYGFTKDWLVTKTEPIGQGQGQGAAWVKTIFADFLGADNTPFDTYMLLSLVAPRGLFVSAGYYDNGTDPEGMYASYLGAQQAYKLLGEEGNIAFGSYPTEHAGSTAETNDFLAFCDYYFYGTELPQGFYDTVYDNSPDRAEYDVIRIPDAPPAYYRDLLQKTYDYALTLSTDGVVDSAVKLFLGARDNAKAVLDNLKSTEDQCEEAFDSLLEGIWGLGLLKGDKTVLEILIAKADRMVKDADKYVAANWQNLLDKLEEARKVMNDADAMEEDIAPAADDLLDAIMEQRFKARKDILENMLKKAEKVDESLYTDESAAAFRTAYAYAIKIMADDTLSEFDQPVVDQAAKDLDAAMLSLVKKDNSEDPSVPEDPEEPDDNNQPSDDGKADTPDDGSKADDVQDTTVISPKTGDGFNLEILLVWAAAGVLCIVLAGVRKKKREE